MILVRILVVTGLVVDMFLLYFGAYGGAGFLNLSFREWFAIEVIGAIAMLFAWVALELMHIHRRIYRAEVKMCTARNK